MQDTHDEFVWSLLSMMLCGLLMPSGVVLFGFKYTFIAWFFTLVPMLIVGVLLYDSSPAPIPFMAIAVGFGGGLYMSLPGSIFVFSVVAVVYAIMGQPFPDPPVGLLLGCYGIN